MPFVSPQNTTWIRDALRSLPTLAATSTSNEPGLSDIFFPIGHVEALDPEVSLVIGNRGMGKTFWSRALANDELRPTIVKKFEGLKSWELDEYDVLFGFSDAEGSKGAVSQAHLAQIRKTTSTDLIWRAVLVRQLAQLAGLSVPKAFKELVEWVKKDPDGQLNVLRLADERLSKSGRKILFLFDQLDQLATDWDRIQELTKGLLRTALAMKSYRCIKLKIFMRPDQAEDPSIYRFPDASKISGGRRFLTWRPTDLYGLLFFELKKRDTTDEAFASFCKAAGIRPDIVHKRLNIPVDLAWNSDTQGQVFDLIAGAMMGSGSKRGRPYSWIPTHLADAKGEISPRTFLKVMKVAAVHALTSMPSTAIDFGGISQGVREASRDRLRELEEDYPWIPTALSALKGLHVPCAPQEMYARWQSHQTVSVITSNYRGTRAPIDLLISVLLENDDGPQVLQRSLREVGVLEERASGKLNIPDIYRVNAGILRKGGVSPPKVADS